MAEDAGDTDNRYGTYEYLCNKYPSANRKLSIGEEEQLVGQAKAGDRKAFESLLKQAQRSMLVKAWITSGRSFPLTDEAMGAAFEKLLKGLPNFKRKNKEGKVVQFVTWAVTVAKNACKDLVRKKNTENKYEDLLEENDVIPDTESGKSCGSRHYEVMDMVYQQFAEQAVLVFQKSDSLEESLLYRAFVIYSLERAIFFGDVDPNPDLCCQELGIDRKAYRRYRERYNNFRKIFNNSEERRHMYHMLLSTGGEN